jgi:hypothetical protein
MSVTIENKNIEQESIINNHNDDFFIRLNNYFKNPNTCFLSSCVCILAIIIFLMLLWAQKDLVVKNKPIIHYPKSIFSNIPYDL